LLREFMLILPNSGMRSKVDRTQIPKTAINFGVNQCNKANAKVSRKIKAQFHFKAFPARRDGDGNENGSEFDDFRQFSNLEEQFCCHTNQKLHESELHLNGKFAKKKA